MNRAVADPAQEEGGQELFSDQNPDVTVQANVACTARGLLKDPGSSGGFNAQM